jgi:lysophospholipase L1-like esterase
VARPSITARIVLVFVSIVLAGFVSEMALRGAGYRYSPLHVEIAPAGDWREQHAFHDRNFVYDPVLIWRPKVGAFSPYGPEGFRGGSVSQEKAPGSTRIIAVGDSNTFGWVEDPAANWPAQLQLVIQQRSPRAEVLNAGVWGYSSFQGLRRFKEVVAFHPDLVLVSFGANDAHQVTTPDGTYVDSYVRSRRLEKLTSKLRVGQALVGAWDRIAQASRRGAALSSRVPLEEYQANLREIVAVARANHATPVLLTRPFIGTSTDPAWWKTHAPSYVSATIDVGRSENVPVVDVFAAFHDKPQYFDDESHFNLEGHRAAAAYIYERIEPLLAEGSR